MADDKKITYDKGVVPRRDEFQSNLKLKGEVLSFVRETLEKVTEEAFSEAGFPKSDKPSGVYADGRAWGMGTATSFFNVKIGGQTQTMMEKQISFGGKRMFVEVQIAIQTNSSTVDIRYRTTEASAFRGYSSSVGGMMINEQLHFDLKNMEQFKKDFTKKMKEFAEKEAAYMSSTKLGVEDPIEKSTASIVENKMKIKDILSVSDEDFINRVNETFGSSDAFSVLNDEVEQPVPDTEDLLLSDKELAEEKMSNIDHELDRSVLNQDVIITNMNDENGKAGQTGTVVSFVRPTERDMNQGYRLYSYVVKFPEGQMDTYLRSEFSTLDEALTNEDIQKRISEITTAGAGAGSIGRMGYDAPIGKPARRKFADTEYGKRARLREEKGTWSPRIVENDGFWTVVSQETLNKYKKNHIMGAPGAEDIEVNSEAEEQYNSGGVNKFPQGKAFKDGDFEKYNASEKEVEDALQESINDYLKIHPSVRKKWVRQEIVTESQKKSRWERLSTLETNETIKKAESVTPDVEMLSESTIKKVDQDVEVPMNRNQSIDEGDFIDGKKVIKVSKKNSLFNIEYMVNEEDYLNERKAYIHDYNTGNLINNPNYKPV